MSRRTEKFASLVHRIIAEGLLNRLKGRHLTVSRVEVTQDLKRARIWVSALESKQTQLAKHAQQLEDIRGELQRDVAENIQGRFAPQIELLMDTSRSDSEKIDRILGKARLADRD